MYLTESACKKNQTYNLNSGYLNVLVLFNIWTLFKVDPRVEKTEAFKNVDILQAVLVLPVASWKNIFFIMEERNSIFSLFSSWNYLLQRWAIWMRIQH